MKELCIGVVIGLIVGSCCSVLADTSLAVQLRPSVNKVFAHLDAEELAAIKEACK